MGNLRTFLEANRNEIVDFVQGNQRPIALSNNVYGKLLNELVSGFPMEKDGTSLVLDKAHIELAIAILESLWCGWLAQAKANDGRYQKDMPQKFKELILMAFDIGKEYSKIRP